MPPQFDNYENRNDCTSYKKGHATTTPLHIKLIPCHHSQNVTRHLLQLLSVFIAVSYALFFSFYSGTVMFCSREPAPCPEPIVVVAADDKFAKWKFWRRKKTATTTESHETTVTVPKNEIHPVCYFADDALKGMRSVLPLLDNMSLVGSANMARSCPDPKPCDDGGETKKGFFHREIALFEKYFPGRQKRDSGGRRDASSSQIESSYETWTADQTALIRELASETRQLLKDEGNFEKRMKSVAWGGDRDVEWWSFRGGEAEAELLLGYTLKIMKWPKDLRTNFPFKPCPKTCPATFALSHTLQYREHFRPWLVTPSVLVENADGIIFHHGHSGGGGPSLVWYRPGQQSGPYRSAEAYLRAMVSTLEFAVTDSLRHTEGKMGQFDVVVDAGGFKLSNAPGLDQIKRFFLILQDHFPNRLGHLFVANLSTATQLFMKVLLPFVTEEVRKKIHIVSNDAAARRELLDAWIGEKFVPDWLGGSDTWKFNLEEYYKDKIMGSDEEGRRYLETMPYHS